jgi:hypothetical protein
MAKVRTTPDPLDALLRRLDACGAACEWARPYGTDYRRAWEECPNGEWMLWALAALNADPKLLRLCACDAARLALPHVPAGEERPLRAIETAERFTRGEATAKELAAASAADSAAASAADRAAARAAAWAADRAAASAAASAAARAAAWAAASAAARVAAWAADSAADRAAAWAAARAAARAAAQKQIADLVRKRVPWRTAASLLNRDTVQE